MKITLKPNQQLWFTSDSHYSHANITEGLSTWEKGRGQRPFQTVDDMNDTLVKNINGCAQESDILIHLGDFSFGGISKVSEFRERIICKEVILVLGNHDHHIRSNKTGLQDLFTRTTSYLELSVNKQQFILFHFPIVVWDCVGQGAIMLHGHTHKRPEKRIGKGRMLDVGLDGHPEFRPYGLGEIMELVSTRPIGCYLEDDYHTRERL